VSCPFYLSDSSCQSVNQSTSLRTSLYCSLTPPSFSLILPSYHHQHYPSPYRLIHFLFTFLLSILHFCYIRILFPSTLLYLLHPTTCIHFHCHCFPCQSRLQPAISSFATLTHSLCVPVTNRLLVILALPRTAIARTKSGTGYRRAHTLSRSLRDRQLATTCHTPPPTLLGLATVQNEKSHIPPRQAVTHLNASRLAP
jgi:hypothetical protein